MLTKITVKNTYSINMVLHKEMKRGAKGCNVQKNNKIKLILDMPFSQYMNQHQNKAEQINFDMKIQPIPVMLCLAILIFRTRPSDKNQNNETIVQ